MSAAIPPAADPAVRSTERVSGLDLARAVAILGMVIINFKESFVDMEAAAAGLLAWLSVLSSGRASTLFVTLAGVGIMLMGRGAETGAVARVLLKRSLFLLVAGNLLYFIWEGDILHFYAFYLFFSAIIFIHLPRRALLPLAALAALAGPLLHLLFGSIDPEAIEYHSAHGMFIDIVGWGLHPIFPWFTFILTGFWIGHLDLRDRGTRRALALGGALLACGAPLADLVIGHLAALGLLPGRALSLLGTLWSPGLLFTLGRVGTAVFAIAVAQSIAGRLPGSIIVRSLVATGQLSFTIYIFHVVVWIHLFSRVTGVEEFGLARLFLHVASFYLFIVPAGAIYRRFWRRGPIEGFMRLLCGDTPQRTVAPPPAVRLARPPVWAWLPVLPALPAILVIQLAGTPLGWIAESTPLAEGRRYAEITVFSDEATWMLELNEESEIVIETFSDRDLYLEIFDENGETIAESDDDGIAYNGRIHANFDPGRYRVVVSSLDKIPGAFVLKTQIGPARTFESSPPGTIWLEWNEDVDLDLLIDGAPAWKLGGSTDEDEGPAAEWIVLPLDGVREIAVKNNADETGASARLRVRMPDGRIESRSSWVSFEEDEDEWRAFALDLRAGRITPLDPVARDAGSSRDEAAEEDDE